MSSLKRAPKPAAPIVSTSSGGEPACVVELPTLIDFLALSQWPDGCRRLLGTVSLFWEEGRYKCWLNDKDGQRSTCVSGATLTELLLCVDARLSADDLEWRKARPEPARARGK